MRNKLTAGPLVVALLACTIGVARADGAQTTPPAADTAATTKAPDTTAPADKTISPKSAAAANALIDKAVTALGGADKLSKIAIVTWKTTGTMTFNGDSNPVTSDITIQGLDHRRQDFSGTFGGNPVKGSILIAGDAGSRNFGDNAADLDKDAIAVEKRNTYLAMIPITLQALKSKDFRVETIEDATSSKPAAPAGAADKPATVNKPLVGIKVTPLDGKEFSLYFDKDTGLPAKLVAAVVGFDGNEYTQETTFADYKPMAGIVVATKVEAKRDGAVFLSQQITDFQILDKVDPKTFTTP